MAWKKLNQFVDVYDKPVYSSDHPVMALSILKKKENNKYLGIVREIVERSSDPSIPGNVDKSKLYIVESSNCLNWKQKLELKIDGIDNIIEDLTNKNMAFIGLEDPDIFIENNLIHVFFTIAYKLTNKPGYMTYLGHAQGNSLYNLEATQPVMSPNINNNFYGFKEVAISPEKYSFGRINLAESFHRTESSEGHSVIISAKAKNMSKPWQFIKIVVHPVDIKYKWIEYDTSPCCMLPRDFITLDSLLVAIINGREKPAYINNKKVCGRFTIGLALFDPKTGNIPWISDRPLIDDTSARNIVFASDFLRLDKNNGILYAHIDDSYIKAYKLNSTKLKEFIKRQR